MDTPSTKVGAGAIGGAITALIVWGINALTNADIPAEVAAAITVIVTFLLSYFIPESNPAPSAETTVIARTSTPSGDPNVPPTV